MLGKLKITTLIFMILFFNKDLSANYEKLAYDFKFNSIDGDELNLSKFKNKVIIVINVASKCGFTKQYSGLQALYEKYKDKGLVIIGIPSNQFGVQVPGSNKEIKDFCEINFNITFPITDKVDVKGKNAHSIYLWAKENYGNSTVPKWNFHKILINKNGKIQNTYNSFIKPMSKKIIKEIELIL